jgi:glycerophosphoryl diester phosphodiesterase
MRSPLDIPRRRFLKFGTAAAAYASLGSPFAHSAEARMSTARELILRRDPVLVGHRGLPGEAPENTLPAFEAAMKHRPDFIELDYRHSGDGVPIVIHDEKLDRTTDARALFGGENILIGTKTAKELAPLDAGRWKDERFAGTVLPTLEAALDLMCPTTCVMIERKDGDAETLIKLLHAKKLTERVIIQAFDWNFIDDCRRLDPKIPTGLLGSNPLDTDKIAKAKAIGAEVVGWKEQDLDEAGLKAAQNAGFQVWSWTVNKEERARELVRWGLNGLITNHCDQAREWLTAS